MQTAEFKKAIALHQSGKVNQAYAIYKSLEKSEPNNIQLIELLAMSAAQLGHIDEAVQLLHKGINNHPHFAPFYNNLGHLYTKRNQLNLAEQQFKKALSIDSGYANAANNLANIYYKTQQMNKAKQYYQMAIDKDPQFADPYFNLAIISCGENQLEIAKIGESTWHRPPDPKLTLFA